jgi:hypothetical protein
MLLGALVSGWLLLRRFGAFLPPLTALRVVLACAVCVAVGRGVPASSPVTALAMAGTTAVLFLGVLVVTGVLGRRDLAMVKNVLKRRRS